MITVDYAYTKTKESMKLAIGFVKINHKSCLNMANLFIEHRMLHHRVATNLELQKMGIVNQEIISLLRKMLLSRSPMG